MSVDLAWELLHQSLADTLVDALNRTLASTTRPSFVGPVEVTSFEFGSNAPEVEVVDVRDIHRDFLEDDPEDLDDEENYSEEKEYEEYEWISRREAAREQLLTPQTPGHLVRGQSFGARDFFGGVGVGGIGIHGLPRTLGTGGIALGGVGSVGIGLSPLRQSVRPSPVNDGRSREAPAKPLSHEDEPASSPTPAPSLQMHLRVLFHSNLRLAVKTSVLLNYPSESFLSLPVKLVVTGLVFDGEVVVAYEVPKRRVHLCIVDDLDPYGLASNRKGRVNNLDASTESIQPAGVENGSSRGSDQQQPLSSPVDRSLPIGQRLLPSIFIETEIGQTDKHVLRNVTRVERFLQDAIRKTLEDELVFPNFHTVILG